MDFHAIRSEGVNGLPGSESAGIIAFIRERLVDLGEDSHLAAADNPDDVKAQRNLEKEDIDETNTFESLPAAKFKYRELSEPGYILDKIPLLDMDLGSSGSRRAILTKSTYITEYIDRQIKKFYQLIPMAQNDGALHHFTQPWSVNETREGIPVRV
ncbi:hypothetical protein C8F04DRAFT_1189497 [Mycena alexandri]|uniref:Uncharacterized protein n=1 Tax=Mycena alexandri TaxID=1745969 RepID=A0AAD6WXZ9_9AGAR|nr:hypothetical protein C8F04DRAFT_1189497 [Mycena alexandri]